MPSGRIQIPIHTAITMIVRYLRNRISAQLKAVAFIVLYLIVFQVFILGAPIPDALTIAVGIAMVVVGLAVFLEGLLLGLMPLGERVGVALPARVGVTVIAVFGALVGVGATLAEPAIVVLRSAGTTVRAWESPILFALLQVYTEWLLLAVAGGVGIAVALGMIRFYFGLSLKPFVFITIPLLLALSVYAALGEGTRSIIGLAWDTGAVTTGAVTVPLVLALGLGVSRAVGTRGSSGSGYGLIMLASALPVAAVLLLGIWIAERVPGPVEEVVFFSPERRLDSAMLFDDEVALRRHAWTRGSENARRAVDGDGTYRETLDSLYRDTAVQRRLIGSMTLHEWRTTVASEDERRFVGQSRSPEVSVSLGSVIRKEASNTVRAVVPIVVLLLTVLLLFLRDAPRYRDEIVFGIVCILIGMTVLTTGIRIGLTPLGDEVGRRLPRAFQTSGEEAERVAIEEFERDLLVESVDDRGERRLFFYLNRGDSIELVPFVPERYDEDQRRYEHIVQRPPLFGPGMSPIGIILVLLFAFGLGYGATVAEPALRTLGRTAEELTVGTVKESRIVRVVATGVGAGLVTGMVKILYDLPILWVLLPPYVAVLVLTIWNDEDFAGLAWDSGGVTTGPVTVPLVLAMGLGVGGALGVSDGFGVLAAASVYPILAMLLFGLWTRLRNRRIVRATNEEGSDG